MNRLSGRAIHGFAAEPLVGTKGMVRVWARASYVKIICYERPAGAFGFGQNRFSSPQQKGPPPSLEKHGEQWYRLRLARTAKRTE
jgi:hypothetical protein